MIILGLAVSNGLIALAGAFLAQYQGFADVQMGIGMVVWGLASVIIGEALVGARTLGLTITGAVMGSVLFRLLVAIALAVGIESQRSETDYGGVCFCRAGSARISQQAQIPEGRPFPCLKSDKFARPSTRARRMRCGPCKAWT